MFISGPISVVFDNPFPTFNLVVELISIFSNLLKTFSCIITLDAAVHLCPVVPNAPHKTPSKARFKFASSIIIIAFLLPNSKFTFFNPAFSRINFPVSLDPVKDNPRILGCLIIGFPTLFPEPVTKFKTPFGNPTFSIIFTSSTAQRGVSELGLKIIVFPQINAGAIFHAGIAIGKFHGVINPTTPMGILTVALNLFFNSLGVVLPKSLLPSPAMYSKISTAS